MLSSGVYGLFYASIGWRGMLWIGVLPALSVFFVRKFVKEPPIWLENRRRQRLEQREVHAPLISIFQKQILANTLTACVWLGGGFIAYYSVNALFATHLQKDLHLTPGLVATPIFFANLGHSCVVRMGLVGRPHWPTLVDYHSGTDRATARTALPALHRFPVDCGRLYRAGNVRRRRHAGADGGVPE